MTTVAEIKETLISLDDIREKLNALEDKSLSADILDALKKYESQIAEKTAIIAQMTEREQSLITANQKLYDRVSMDTDKQLPNSQVNYDDVLRDGIENILKEI